MTDPQLLEILSAALAAEDIAETVASSEPFRELACYRGKVRDCYIDPVHRERWLVASDRLSAFDRILCRIPFKGQVLSRLAEYWFRQTVHLVPNHLLAMPDPQITIARELTPIPVEFVVRGYLTGVTSTSIWQAYQRGDRLYAGHILPDGLRKNDPLPQPLVTPSTKAPHGGHDVTVSRDELIAAGHVRADVFDRAAEYALRLFVFGQAHVAAHGLILADTKYEFGLDAAGSVVLMDELHTPDSSRYWLADSYHAASTRGEEPESRDKEYVRRYLREQLGYDGTGEPPPIPNEVRIELARRYVRVYEQITGQEFLPDARPARQRVQDAFARPLSWRNQ